MKKFILPMVLLPLFSLAAGQNTLSSKDIRKDSLSVDYSRKQELTQKQVQNSKGDNVGADENNGELIHLSYHLVQDAESGPIFEIGARLENNQYFSSGESYRTSGLAAIDLGVNYTQPLETVYLKYGLGLSLSPGVRRVSDNKIYQWTSSNQGYHLLRPYVGNDFYLKEKIRMGFEAAPIITVGFAGGEDSANAPQYSSKLGTEFLFFTENPIYKKTNLGLKLGASRFDFDLARFIDNDGKTGSLAAIYLNHELDGETLLNLELRTQNQQFYEVSNQTQIGFGLVRAL